MRINKLLTLFALAGALTLCACQKESGDNRRHEARKLYVKEINILSAYCDSMKQAQDSLRAARLDSCCLAALTDLNMRNEPELDAALTEGENDTLYMLTNYYVKLRDKKFRIKYTPSEAADSLSKR